MRQIHRKGLATVMLTGGALAMAGYAHADSHADGGAADSPGELSGNTAQVPVKDPVEACGDTVKAVGLLNPAAGKSCANPSHSGQRHSGEHDKSGGHQASGTHRTSGGATVEGASRDSSGVLAGNGVQRPVVLPATVTGNSVNVVGTLNPAFGNSSDNCDKPPVSPPKAVTPPVSPPKAVTPPKVTPPKEVKPYAPTPRNLAPTQALAHTGAGPVAYAVPAGAALLLGGVLLYRRSRSTS